MMCSICLHITFTLSTLIRLCEAHYFEMYPAWPLLRTFIWNFIASYALISFLLRIDFKLIKPGFCDSFILFKTKQEGLSYERFICTYSLTLLVSFFLPLISLCPDIETSLTSLFVSPSHMCPSKSNFDWKLCLLNALSGCMTIRHYIYLLVCPAFIKRSSVFFFF